MDCKDKQIAEAKVIVTKEFECPHMLGNEPIVFPVLLENFVTTLQGKLFYPPLTDKGSQSP